MTFCIAQTASKCPRLRCFDCRTVFRNLPYQRLWSTRYSMHGSAAKSPKINVVYTDHRIQKSYFHHFLSDLTPRTPDRGLSRFKKKCKKLIKNWSCTDRYYPWTKQFQFFPESTSRQECLTTPYLSPAKSKYFLNNEQRKYVTDFWVWFGVWART